MKHWHLLVALVCFCSGAQAMETSAWDSRLSKAMSPHYLLAQAPSVAPAPAPAPAPAAPPAGPTKADSFLQTAWADLAASSSFHLLDNAMPGYFHDSIHDEDLGGVTSTLYYNSKAYLSADFGVIGGQAPGSNQWSGFPLAAVNFHAGTLLSDKVPGVASLAKQATNNASIMNTFTIGAWIARDFNGGVYRGGPFTGFQFRWGSVSSSQL